MPGLFGKPLRDRYGWDDQRMRASDQRASLTLPLSVAFTRWCDHLIRRGVADDVVGSHRDTYLRFGAYCRDVGILAASDPEMRR